MHFLIGFTMDTYDYSQKTPFITIPIFVFSQNGWKIKGKKMEKQ